jgi:hypothetical protein
MKTLKNILIIIHSYIDISIISNFSICNFKKSFFILFFLQVSIAFSQTPPLHISPDTQLIGLEQLYVKEIDETSTETLQIKNIYSSGTFFVHSSTLVYFQTDQKINIVFIGSQNKTITYHKNNKSLVVIPKKTSKIKKVFFTSHNSSSGASGFSSDFASIIPVNTYKKIIKLTAFATHDVPYIKVLQKQNQVTSYHKNLRTYLLPIAYSNRPPPSC